MNKSRHAKLTIPTEKKLASVSNKGFSKVKSIYYYVLYKCYTENGNESGLSMTMVIISSEIDNDIHVA